MDRMGNLISQLNKSYFWDTDFDSLDENKSKRLIVERVINFGNLTEIKLILEYYGLSETKNIVRNLAYIDPKTLNFLSLLFNIPKTEFRCYIQKRLKNQPWNY
jgi:hypothetical protein